MGTCIAFGDTIFGRQNDGVTMKTKEEDMKNLTAVCFVVKQRPRDLPEPTGEETPKLNENQR